MSYIERNRKEDHIRIWNDYFSETPTYPENLFRRCFRMNKPLFMHIVDRLSNEVQFFRQKKDGLGRLGLSTLKSVQHLFVSWHMVLRLTRLTNISGSVEPQLGHVWRILWTELFICLVMSIYEDQHRLIFNVYLILESIMDFPGW